MMAKALAKFLLEYTEKHGDRLVVLSKDSEGNSFSPLPNEGFYCDGHYTPDSTWSGDFVGKENEEDRDEDEDEELGDDAVPALALWPTN